MDEDFPSPDAALPGAAYRVLLQVALLGTEIGEIALSMDIAETLADLRPDLPHASIVLAMSDFSAGRKDEGVHRLQDTLIKFPDTQLGKAMLAVCLQNSGRPGWQPLLEAVIEDGRDEYAVGLASTLLGRPLTGALAAEDGALPATTPSYAMWA